MQGALNGPQGFVCATYALSCIFRGGEDGFCVLIGTIIQAIIASFHDV